jgi:hypothetical protein
MEADGQNSDVFLFADPEYDRSWLEPSRGLMLRYLLIPLIYWPLR